MKRGGKRGRLVGAGVAGRKGGDACVAHGGSCDAMAQQGEGDASVPTPHNPTPAPMGTKALPKRHDKIPTRERDGDEGDASVPTPHRPPPPPLRVIERREPSGA